MRLIDTYIQEVTRRLPEKMRPDIALELHSTIEDMLPDNYQEEDVKGALNQLGNPVVLANGYKDRPLHLIGPRYFDVYLSLLKMIVPIAAVVSLIAIITEYFIDYSGEEAILTVVFPMIGKAIGTVIDVAIQVFFWLTLTFALIERFDKDKDQQPLTSSLEKWTADDLKNIEYTPKKTAVSKLAIFGNLMTTAIWAALYFYGNQLMGIYEGDKNIIPALNQEVLLRYWPIIVIVIVLEIAFSLYKLLKEKWTKRIAIFNTCLQIITTIVFIIILTNPNLMNQAFITYITDLFTITKDQLNMWIVGGGIIILMISAVVNIFDGFKKARVR